MFKPRLKYDILVNHHLYKLRSGLFVDKLQIDRGYSSNFFQGGV